jgi:hypothetical protein
MKNTMINKASDIQLIQAEFPDFVGLLNETSPVWTSSISQMNIRDFKTHLEILHLKMIALREARPPRKHINDISYLKHYITLINHTGLSPENRI